MKNKKKQGTIKSRDEYIKTLKELGLLVNAKTVNPCCKERVRQLSVQAWVYEQLRGR